MIENDLDRSMKSVEIVKNRTDANNNSNNQQNRRPSSLLLFGDKMIAVSANLKQNTIDHNKKLYEEFKTFANKTSAHGIPLALFTKKLYVKTFWICLSITLFLYFLYQCSLIVDKYHRKDKIVQVELKFESAPFPAITVCNLNPFKKHLARTVPEISDTLDAFYQAVSYSKDAASNYLPISKLKRDTAETVIAGFRYIQYAPVLSNCICVSNRTCIQRDTVPLDNRSLCICNYDQSDQSAWPCFNASTWYEAICPDCNDIGFCNLPTVQGETYMPCICQTIGEYCLIRPGRLKRIWEFRSKAIPSRGSPYRAEFLEQLKQLGYENMTDEVAITTKTKERMILAMAALPVHRRIALSYGKTEFIRMCSFNGQQCDIVDDFRLHADPSLGNCYTFNADRHRPLVSGRAGPSYGLRMMLFVNASDYLPTTEAAGVRIAIHGQDEHPFPDTFGYSAPTGAVSSFGLSMKKVNRLSVPYGDCIPNSESLPSDYIYKDHKYEPEGCFRSCYQNRIIRKCNCMDPRYSVSDTSLPYCNTASTKSRNCMFVEEIKFTRSPSCRCKHPCQQNVYTTTYSAAKWPSGSQQIGTCNHTTKEECIEYHRLHAALIEIYFEQIRYEILNESVSYLVVNLISDIGGQAGLWLGASVITLLELIIFIVRILTLQCRKRGTIPDQLKTSGQASEPAISRRREMI